MKIKEILILLSGLLIMGLGGCSNSMQNDIEDTATQNVSIIEEANIMSTEPNMSSTETK